MHRSETASYRPNWRMTFMGVVSLGLLAGCGSGLAPVSGKVTYQGKPVKGGNLIFSPVGGQTGAKPASAEIQPDGTYKLGTSSPGDGAHVGKHRVTFTPPEQKLTEQQRTDPKYKAPPPPYLGLAPKQTEVEVTSGNNTIDIELVPAQNRPR